jgi:KUP system potassium uptake protein
MSEPPDPEPTGVHATPRPGETGTRPVPPAPLHQHQDRDPRGKRLALLAVAALGVVYGDIGTSPLYAFRAALTADASIAVTPANVLGVLSLILWSLIGVVAVKYIGYILRADNRGEGGILALLALALQEEARSKRRRTTIIMLGLFGAALLYGDGMITPAISVLSAVEGLAVVSPALEHLVLPLSAGILFALFALQRFGTAKVGIVFGPLTFVWFSTIAALGVAEILRTPSVLQALNPLLGVGFLWEFRGVGLAILGGVVLAITGAEALYADMGHFGKRPIRLAWFVMVLPCLLLNYFGQGALVIRDPAAISNPFYQLAPGALLYPLIAVATSAAIIASQAMISGAFSVTQQCVQLGYAPRVTIVHTSRSEAGQIYIPEINTALMVGCLLVALSFGSAEALEGAYGLAVMGTMSVTCLLFSIVARKRFGWSAWQQALFLALFLTVDLTFLAATATKIPHGGWFPLVGGVVIFTLMTSWKRGRLLLRERMSANTLPTALFLDDIGRNPRIRVSGTAVFMTGEPEGIPSVLLHHLKHNKVLHDQVVLLSILPADTPDVRPDERMTVTPLDHGFFRVMVTYGFMESPDVKQILQWCNERGLRTRPLETTYYLGRERLIPVPTKKGDKGTTMAMWRKALFAFMNRNAIPATQFFNIPPNRVVELGTQVEI